MRARDHDACLCCCVCAHAGHRMFQKYAVVAAAAWVIVPPAVVDIVVCACGCVKAEQARVVPAALASEPFFPADV
jgi:hypothetical protein